MHLLFITRILCRAAQITWAVLYHNDKKRTARRLLFLKSDKLLVVDELVLFVVPAVQLSDLLADLLGRMLCVQLSHSLEVNL